MVQLIGLGSLVAGVGLVDGLSEDVEGLFEIMVDDGFV